MGIDSHFPFSSSDLTNFVMHNKWLKAIRGSTEEGMEEFFGVPWLFWKRNFKMNDWILCRHLSGYLNKMTSKEYVKFRKLKILVSEYFTQYGASINF